MAKFYGEVGYAQTRETSPGVWTEETTERSYYGDVLKHARKLEPGESANDNPVVINRISIVADAYAYENILAIRYVRWLGALWKITNVEVERPRLILTIGGSYHEA